MSISAEALYQVRDQVFIQALNQAYARMKGQTPKQVWDPAWGGVQDEANNQIRHQIEAQAQDQIRGGVA